jgi:hypothetical protein
MAGLDLFGYLPDTYVNDGRVVSTAGKDFRRPLFRAFGVTFREWERRAVCLFSREILSERGAETKETRPC